mmetsp:Transcript_8189/g.17922  ORF Transcript_8189/g.17922 Transcript_8189/m.17922 type:complete len:284 (+) Transcript_8189:109-960(+)
MSMKWCCVVAFSKTSWMRISTCLVVVTPQSISWWKSCTNFSTVSLFRMDLMARTTDSSSPVSWSPALRAFCCAAQEFSEASSFFAGASRIGLLSIAWSRELRFEGVEGLWRRLSTLGLGSSSTTAGSRSAISEVATAMSLESSRSAEPDDAVRFQSSIWRMVMTSEPSSRSSASGSLLPDELIRSRFSASGAEEEEDEEVDEASWVPRASCDSADCRQGASLLAISEGHMPGPRAAAASSAASAAAATCAAANPPFDQAEALRQGGTRPLKSSTTGSFSPPLR